ncbi:helix-turn-helix domain-containing protein [Micromonospora sp. NPDC000207]|uniref:helix-turn-helix domain-containing protein n=1 Tax=Micromonospora sp. NPDC000207 TaxID=3154246 RepID=UPI00332B24FA
MDAKGDETWLRFGDAVKMLKPLGITDQTIRNWADGGRLKSFRLGPDGKSGHRKIALSSVLRELEQAGVTPPVVAGVKLPPKPA